MEMLILQNFFITNGFVPALICVIGCYLYIIGTVPKFAVEPSLTQYSSSSSSKEYLISWNLIESSKVYYEHPCRPDLETSLYTNFSEEPELRCVAVSSSTKGTERRRILLIGNSIAYRAYPLIHDILAGRYRTFRLYSKSCGFSLISALLSTLGPKRVKRVPACPPLSDWCPEFSKATRHEPIVAPVKDLKTDPIYNQFQSNVDFFSNYSKHIVIDMPYYKYPDTITAAVLAKRIQQGLPPGDDLAVTWE
ncbi:hypothetical protein COOONC_20962, partial [Cooperia oncophora]